MPCERTKVDYKAMSKGLQVTIINNQSDKTGDQNENSGIKVKAPKRVKSKVVNHSKERIETISDDEEGFQMEVSQEENDFESELESGDSDQDEDTDGEIFSDEETTSSENISSSSDSHNNKPKGKDSSLERIWKNIYSQILKYWTKYMKNASPVTKE